MGRLQIGAVGPLSSEIRSRYLLKADVRFSTLPAPDRTVRFRPKPPRGYFWTRWKADLGRAWIRLSRYGNLGTMEKTFVAEREDRPGVAWLARFQAGRDEAARWYRVNEMQEPPTSTECIAALRRYMPELVSAYDDVCGLVGSDDLAHRILSHYRPASLPHGCSQAVWLGDGGPALVRNYPLLSRCVKFPDSLH